MTQNSLNCYPSTSDLPLIAGGQDPVLVILQEARKRYERHGIDGSYMGSDGVVCAVGAVMAAAGVTRDAMNASDEGIEYGLPHFGKMLRAMGVEREMANAAKEAMKLLNREAEKMYPESRAEARQSGYVGPLEWINEDMPDDDNDQAAWEDRKAAVLKCYDQAIAKRQAQS